MILSFELRFSKAKSTKPSPRRRLVARGPDGVLVGFEYQFVKIGKQPMFLRGRLMVEVDAKVRAPVVAHWLLAQVGAQCVGVLLNGVDYRDREDLLARLIDERTSGLADGALYDPPGEDSGG